MTRPAPFQSRLGPTLARYVALKRASAVVAMALSTSCSTSSLPPLAPGR
jgi:hypothetical protein